MVEAVTEPTPTATVRLSTKSMLPSVLDAAIALTVTSLYFVALPTFFRSHPQYWDNLVHLFGSTDKVATFFMTHTFHLVCFVFFNAAVGFFYWLNNPAIERFKTEPDAWPWHSKNPEERKKFWDLMKSTAFVISGNNLLIAVPISWLAYDSARSQGVFDPSSATFPSTATILWQVAVCILVEDFFFYWSHRLLHIPFLFKHIHKTHHKYHCPIGLASEYAHPLEFYFGNIMPPSIGPILVKTHLFTYLIWLGVRFAKTCEAHCGCVLCIPTCHEKLVDVYVVVVVQLLFPIYAIPVPAICKPRAGA
jgi:sterol desaturase/sphingolipid hydroxylase (fatty acid hydroxylase superfamily)